MNAHEYYMVAGGWALLIIVLSIFWYNMLGRLSEVLKGELGKIRSGQPRKGIPGLFLFIIRGEFAESSDSRLVALCSRLRLLLSGYVGVTICYFVFLVLMRPRY